MNNPAQRKSDLDTPCLILDLDILERNLKKMQAVAGAAGKNLRPHAKTHKCSLLAKMQLAAGAVGICAAKVSEAEALVQAGIPNVLVTGPVATPEKIARLISLLRTAPFLMTVVDHPASIELLEKLLAGAGLTLDVLVDLDIGHGRTGVAPGKAMELAERVLASDRLRLRGIQAYAGNVQHIPRYRDRRAASLKGLKQAAAVFRQLQSRAESCTIFSASGTGTAKIDLAIPELTELQAGSYALMDAEYLAIECADGSECADYQPALTMLTTVVSVGHGRQVKTGVGGAAEDHHCDHGIFKRLPGHNVARLDVTFDQSHHLCRSCFRQRFTLRGNWRVFQCAERAADSLTSLVHCLLDRGILADIIHNALDTLGILPATIRQGQYVFIFRVFFSVIDRG